MKRLTPAQIARQEQENAYAAHFHRQPRRLFDSHVEFVACGSEHYERTNQTFNGSKILHLKAKKSGAYGNKKGN